MPENAFIEPFQVPVPHLGHILCRTAMGLHVFSNKTLDQQFFCFLAQSFVPKDVLWFWLQGSVNLGSLSSRILCTLLLKWFHCAASPRQQLSSCLCSHWTLKLVQIWPPAPVLDYAAAEVPHRGSAPFLGPMHPVLPSSAEPEEGKSSLPFCSGRLCPGNTSFHSRFVIGPCLHACKKVTDLTDFLSVNKANMEIPKCWSWELDEMSPRYVRRLNV